MELRYNLLTFTIFIIQLQVGAIPVFSHWCRDVLGDSVKALPLPMGRDKKIWTAPRTNQIAGFVTSKEKVKIPIQWIGVTKQIALSMR